VRPTFSSRLVNYVHLMIADTLFYFAMVVTINENEIRSIKRGCVLICVSTHRCTVRTKRFFRDETEYSRVLKYLGLLNWLPYFPVSPPVNVSCWEIHVLPARWSSFNSSSFRYLAYPSRISVWTERICSPECRNNRSMLIIIVTCSVITR